MYRPSAFRENRVEVLINAMRAHPLALLVTAGEEGLMANLLPFHLGEADKGLVLQAHLAKANDQIQHLRNDEEVLVVFQGPQAYVTPSWYATKAEHGKVVPTWNYVVVQARGRPAVIEEAEWLSRQLDDLTRDQERVRAAPWAVNDAPEAFIAAQKRGIVGLEIPVDRLEGKWKVSQNQPEANRVGVRTGLLEEGRSDLAAQMRG